MVVRIVRWISFVLVLLGFLYTIWADWYWLTFLLAATVIPLALELSGKTLLHAWVLSAAVMTYMGPIGVGIGVVSTCLAVVLYIGGMISTHAAYVGSILAVGLALLLSLVESLAYLAVASVLWGFAVMWLYSIVRRRCSCMQE